MLYNERAIREVSSKFEDQNFMYVSFPGGPAFDFTGTMTIDVSEVMEDFGGNFHVYRYLRGVLEKIDATVDADNETVSFETKNLGRFVLTDKEIADGTVVDESFISQPQQPSQDQTTQTGGVSDEGQSNQQTGSVSDSNDYQSGKANPETGAEDFVGLAAAGAVAAAAAGAVLFRKRK